MDRKQIAGETLEILEQGYYEYDGNRIDIAPELNASVRASSLITPRQIF